MNAGEGPVIGTKRRKKPKGKEKALNPLGLRYQKLGTPERSLSNFFDGSSFRKALLEISLFPVINGPAAEIHGNRTRIGGGDRNKIFAAKRTILSGGIYALPSDYNPAYEGQVDAAYLSRIESEHYVA